LIGCPIPRSLTTSCVCFELRSLPSTGVTRLQRYCEPLRHPKAPDLSLAGVRLVIADHALRLPVLRTLSLCTCRRQYPGVAAGRNLRSTRPAISAFPDMAVGSAYTSSFSRLARRSLAFAACTLALSPIRDTLIEGFSHFVTSMTAPIASGWSGCRVGFAPTGKRRLCTAHATSGHSGHWVLDIEPFVGARLHDPPTQSTGNRIIGYFHHTFGRIDLLGRRIMCATQAVSAAKLRVVDALLEEDQLVRIYPPLKNIT
jgi:hypothetical protein